MASLNRQIVETIQRGESAEKSLGNVDSHNPHFTGRSANLRTLRENFAEPGHIGVITAVNGIGGLGKTALGIEYAHAFANEYGGGRWQVRCAGKDDLRLALAELATPIGFEFTEDEKKNSDLALERTCRELRRLAGEREPHRCLLLLDNVDRPALFDPAMVSRLNAGDRLHILATTRLGENELSGTYNAPSFLVLDELPPEDALALIESYQRGGAFKDESERETAKDIAKLLGCLTLAVESAAVYLGRYSSDVTCVAFLERLKKEGLEDLNSVAGQSTEAVLHGEKRLSAALQPTLERLSAAEKLALEFAALLPPDQVALPWLRTLVSQTFPEMGRDAEPGYADPWPTCCAVCSASGFCRSRVSWTKKASRAWCAFTTWCSNWCFATARMRTAPRISRRWMRRLSNAAPLWKRPATGRKLAGNLNRSPPCPAGGMKPIIHRQHGF